MKILRRILLFLLLIIFIAATASYIYLKRQAPQYNGTLEVENIEKETEVLFDEYGIPHIYADNAEDAYFAFGYVHAQERLFQMELIRRLIAGRMSELLGEPLVKTDKYFLTLGVRKQAERMAEIHLSERKTPMQKEAGAYLDGINHFINTGTSPLELTMLGIPKEPYTAVDLFSTMIYMSMAFTGGFKTDIILDQVKNKFGEQYLEDWFMNSTDFLKNRGVVMDSLTVLKESLSLQESFPDNFLPIWDGSNAWLIAPSRSKSGKTITANDTHIPFSQPSVWYEAHLEYPGFSFYGNFLAGVPFAAIGHNKDVSWGLTIFPMDITDLYREKVNPENRNEVWENDHWVAMEVRKETIKVKGGEDISLEVKSTRHGPVINDVFENMGEQPVSLWWSLYGLPGESTTAFYQLAHAKNIIEARKAAALNDFLGLNIMYGDKDGNIAWWASGKIPKRATHINPNTFLDGASGEDELLGYYNFSENPTIENPASGIIVSANQEPPAVNGFVYPGYYVPMGRFDRISELLSQKEKWDIEELKVIHADNTSAIHADNAHHFARELKKSTTFESDPLLDILANWQGDYPLDGNAAVIYTKLVYYITEYAMLDELGDIAFKEAVVSYNYKSGFPKLIHNVNSPWWDDISTSDVKETQSDIFKKAFLQTSEDLKTQLGDDHNSWKWADVHTLTHVHAIGRKEPFDKIFNVGPLAAPGGNGVPNKQQYRLNADGKYEVSGGPALRILLDFADVENSININPTGQSGNFMSPHYNDQAKMYNEVAYRKQKMNRASIEQNAKKLVFSPK